MTLPDRIREAVAPAHAAIEDTPFAQAMVSGRLTPANYSAVLSELAYLHESLEAALAAVRPKSAAIASLYDPERMARTALLDRDLAAYSAVRSAVPDPAVALLSDQFQHWAQTSPSSLLGALYIMEGSRMGSMMIARSLAKAFHRPMMPGVGLDYHMDGMETRPQVWKQFRQSLAELPLSASEQSDVLAAAVETMAGLVSLYSALPVAATAHEPAAL